MKRSVVATMVVAVVLTMAVPAFAGGGGWCADRPVTSEATTQVDLTHNCFGPTIARIVPGDSVTFVNRDPLPHTVTGANLVWGSTDQLDFGQSISVKFDEPGIYPYVCILHVGMVGAVEVVEGVDGSTSIAGERTVLASPLAEPVDVAAGTSNGFSLTLGVWALAMTAILALVVWATRPAGERTS